MIRRHPKKIVIALAVVLIVLGISAPVIYKNRLDLIQSSVVSRFVPLYRSLRKLPDIVFFPYHFRQSNLETISLNISPEDLNTLNSSLPENPFGINNSLNSENKVQVNAIFIAGDYTGEVKVRYRGNAANHWNSYKKSFGIEFPGDNLFRGQKEMNFVIPSDRRYFAMSLNNYRAKKMGLLHPEESYVNLQLNGANLGPYLVFESWSQEWLEKNPVSSLSVLLGVNDDSISGDVDHQISIYKDNGISYWKSWNAEPEVVSDIAKVLIWLASHVSDEDFPRYAKAFLNLDSFYSRDVISVLAGGFHNGTNYPDANNLVLYFDGTTGKVNTLPYNTVLFPEPGYYGPPTALWERIVSVADFAEKRDFKFDEYVLNEKSDDLNFLSDFMKKMNFEYIKDDAKADNNFTYLNEVSELRDSVNLYYNDPYNKFSGQYKGFEVIEGDYELPIRFKHLDDAVSTPREFSLRNPRFVYDGENLRLYRGSYYFSDDIIIPYGTKLIVDSGVNIYLGNNASIISYSPVIMEGNNISPIRVRPSTLGTTWGVFAVINAEGESIFDFVEFSGGGEDTINGVFITGMLALHASDGVITDSVFHDNKGDDAINVKDAFARIENNTFYNTFSDGIDFDYVDQSTILKNNLFRDLGGDAIDLSWTDSVIESNTISNCVDKGVSVGERSNPEIIDNIISGCAIGVAVKDQSVAKISRNIFIGNDVVISSYRKKEIFGGGIFSGEGNTLWGNKNELELDSFSKGELEDSVIERPELNDKTKLLIGDY